MGFTHPFFLFLGSPEEPHIRASGGPFPGHFGTFSLRFLSNLKVKTQPKLPKQNPQKTNKKRKILFTDCIKPTWVSESVFLLSVSLDSGLTVVSSATCSGKHQGSCWGCARLFWDYAQNLILVRIVWIFLIFF